MNLLRRPEVCLLLAAVVAGLVWVAVTQWRPSGPDIPSRGTGNVDDLQVTRALWSTDGSHHRLRVEFIANHRSPGAIEVQPPAVRLMDAANADVPVFFSPGSFPPALPPGTPAASWIEFWLTDAQARGPLTFELGGRQVPIQPAGG